MLNVIELFITKQEIENKKIIIELFHPNGHAMSLKKFMNDKNNRECVANVKWGDKKYNAISGRRGDYAMWLPLTDVMGIKIIFEFREGHPSVSPKTIDLIKNSKMDIFPKIQWHSHAISVSDRTRSCHVILMENVKLSAKSYSYNSKFKEIDGRLECPLDVSDRCMNAFKKLNLVPEDNWYKSLNLIGEKIVDFHSFKIMPERYRFKLNGASKEDLLQIYEQAPRWRTGKPKNEPVDSRDTMYQGYRFEKDITLTGYSSDKKEFDSYRKLPFIPMNQVNGGHVLDIGSNQGFFTFQSVIHGAKSVTSIEYEKKHQQVAINLNNKCFKRDNINFINGDIVDFLKNNKKKFDVAFCFSVLHQIYPNLKKAEKLLKMISDSVEYTIFESPINHPLHKIGIKDTIKILKNHFRIVRLLYAYDAYSPGFRAIFSCYSKHHKLDLAKFS